MTTFKLSNTHSIFVSYFLTLRMIVLFYGEYIYYCNILIVSGKDG